MSETRSTASSRTRKPRWIALAVGVLAGTFIAYQYWPRLESVTLRPVAAKRNQTEAIIDSAPTVLTPVITPDLQDTIHGTAISKEPRELVLVGTLPGSTPREGTAMLGIDARNAHTYVAGALLANGTRIAEIHERYIVLERDDRQVRLYLQDRKSRSTSRPNPEDLTTVGGVVSAVAPVPVNQDPITNYIRPNALYVGDVMRGLEVFAGKQAGVFSQLGLRAGDVLISLDGVPLADVTQAVETLRSLVTGARLDAVLERKGERQSVSLNGALIAADQKRLQQIAASTHAAEPPSPAL
jgi:type II secretion system protein C